MIRLNVLVKNSPNNFEFYSLVALAQNSKTAEIKCQKFDPLSRNGYFIKLVSWTPLSKEDNFLIFLHSLSMPS